MLVQPVTDGPHETPRLVENGIPFISVDAIVDNKIDFSRKRGDVSEEYDAECCKKYKPQYHDVYVVKSGSTVGKVAIVETTDRFNIWSPLAALRCEGKTKPYYLFYLLQTRRMQAQILDKASNGTQPNLSMRELEKFDVLVTDNAEEQQRIGDYFKSLDHLITLHQRKCDETKELKKFMLQKMFPKNGEKNPEIRFDGFTDDWEQRKWIDTVDISTEMVNPASGEYDEFQHIAPGNIESFTGRILDNVKTVKEEQLISGKFRFRPGDVVYGKINPQLGKYFYASTDGLTSADAYVLNGKNGLTQEFLFSLLQTVDFFKYSISVSKRSGMPKINRDELNAYSFFAPDEAEQKKIGTFLLDIDHLITLHQRKCEKLKELKKFMLQNMFV